jgi:hypothetical protein
MSLYDNLFGEDSEKHAVRNGIVTFVLLYAVIKGFENGTLTWPRIFGGLFVLIVFGKIMGFVLGIPSD